MKLMRRILPACLVLVLAAPPCMAGDPPYFTWGSIQRFWNVRALAGSEIKTSIQVPNGYFVDFGLSAGLNVVLEKGRVTRMVVQFDGSQDLGGRRFLKAQMTALRVGTYGWPDGKIEEVREYFRVMLPERREFVWKNSRFTCQCAPNGVWEFALDFIPSED